MKQGRSARTADLTSAVTLARSHPLVANFSTADPGLLLGVSSGETTITATDTATNIEVRATVQVLVGGIAAAAGGVGYLIYDQQTSLPDTDIDDPFPIGR